MKRYDIKYASIRGLYYIIEVNDNLEIAKAIQQYCREAEIYDIELEVEKVFRMGADGITIKKTAQFVERHAQTSRFDRPEKWNDYIITGIEEYDTVELWVYNEDKDEYDEYVYLDDNYEI